MNLFKRKFEVRPNCKGVLYKQNHLFKILEPGIHWYYDWDSEMFLVELPTSLRSVQVTGQEVMTKDQISLRFTGTILYRLVNVEAMAQHFNLFNQGFVPLYELDTIIRNFAQVSFRETIAKLTSEDLNEGNIETLNKISPSLQKALEVFGVQLEKQMVNTINFPKNIQNLFAMQLEAKIKAKTELENARTRVATVRTLKNAANLMDENVEIKYLQYLETLVTLAKKGNHTFVLGEVKT
jgi:hypothetical protein